MKKYAVTMNTSTCDNLEQGWFGKVVRARTPEKAKLKFLKYLRRHAIYCVHTSIIVEEV